MGRCRFVQPGVVRLPLSDGEWVDVKKQLNAGEQRRVFGLMVRDMTAGEKIRLDPEQVGKTKLVEYILQWSLTDAQGVSVRPDSEAIDSLDPDTFAEIVAAVDAHETKYTAEREAEKNAQGGATSASSTSPFVK